MYKRQVYKNIAVPPDADLLSIEFAFYEIDRWSPSDQVKVYIDNVVLDLGSFGPDDKWDTVTKLNNYFTGGSGGISWKRYSLTESTDFGFNKNFKDQTHQVSILIPNQYLTSGFLRLKFEVVLSENEKNESAGFDDIRVMALKHSCESKEDATISPPADMVDAPDVALPVTCRGTAASIAFDVSTWDGLDYSCRAEGEFV